MKRKSIVTLIILTIVTCGVYYLFWMADTQDQLNCIMKDGDSSGGLVVLFSLLTCGVYTLYWYFRVGQKVSSIQACNNFPVHNNSILYLILGVFGFGVISMALVQSDLNAMAPQ